MVCLDGQQLEFVWTHEPPYVRHISRKIVEDFFIWLGENGVAKRSIPIPDRVGGGWILFIYESVDKKFIEAWSPSSGEE